MTAYAPFIRGDTPAPLRCRNEIYRRPGPGRNGHSAGVPWASSAQAGRGSVCSRQARGGTPARLAAAILPTMAPPSRYPLPHGRSSRAHARNRRATGRRSGCCRAPCFGPWPAPAAQDDSDGGGVVVAEYRGGAAGSELDGAARYEREDGVEQRRRLRRGAPWPRRGRPSPGAERWDMPRRRPDARPPGVVGVPGSGWNDAYLRHHCPRSLAVEEPGGEWAPVPFTDESEQPVGSRPAAAVVVMDEGVGDNVLLDPPLCGQDRHGRTGQLRGVGSPPRARRQFSGGEAGAVLGTGGRRPGAVRSYGRGRLRAECVADAEPAEAGASAGETCRDGAEIE